MFAPDDLSYRSLAVNLIIPQRRVFAPLRPSSAETVTIQRVDAQVSIVEQVATTILDISLRNPTGRRLEAEVILPVPSGAAVRGFDFRIRSRDSELQKCSSTAEDAENAEMSVTTFRYSLSLLPSPLGVLGDLRGYVSIPGIRSLSPFIAA